MNETIKLKKCYVDMQFLNPGPCLYNFTIDVMLDLGKELKPRSIVRNMTGFLNLQKPKIPISYIAKNQIDRIIPGKEKLRRYTNLDEICIEQFRDVLDSGKLERKIQRKAKYIIKRLTDDEFRRSPLFQNIWINARGLYEDVDNFVFNMNEFMRLRRMKDLQSVENQNNALMEHHEHLLENQITSVNDTVRNFVVMNDEVVSGQLIEEPTQNDDELFSQIGTNIKSFEDFIESTNIAQLAAKRLNNLNNKRYSTMVKKQLTDIIIHNTWRQFQVHLANGEVIRTSSTNTLDLKKSRNIKTDAQTIQTNNTRYAKIDKPIVPFTYLKAVHNIFPDFYTFVKYTNVIRLLKQVHGLNIEAIIKNMKEWYNDLQKNSQTLNAKYHRLKVNAKYLFVLQYEDGIVSRNSEMLEEEIYRHFDVPSFISYMQPALPEGVPSRSTDVPETKFIPQTSLQVLQNQSSTDIPREYVLSPPNIRMDYTENNEIILTDKEPDLNTRDSRMALRDKELIKNIDMVDKSQRTAQFTLETSQETVIDEHIVTNVKESSKDLVETPLNASTRECSALNDFQPVDQLIERSEIQGFTNNSSINCLEGLPLLGITENQSIQEPPENHICGSEFIFRDKSLSPMNISETATSSVTESSNQDYRQQTICEQAARKSTELLIIPVTRSPYVEVWGNVRTQTVNNEQRNIVIIPICQAKPIANSNQANERSVHILNSENESQLKHRENFENLLDTFVQDIKTQNYFAIFSKSYIKETVISKIDKVMNTNIVTQNLVNVPSTESDVDATQINPEIELNIKTELHAEYSPYSQDVEIIPNVSEILEVEDSMTVSQLLASDDEQSQKVSECYDLLKELKLNDSVNTDSELLQRIDEVLDDTHEVQNGSGEPLISQNLDLSYNDLIRHPNVMEHKRGRRKRKADTEKCANKMINGQKVKLVDLRDSSHTSLQNQHLTTASQLLNSQMSLFLDPQLSTTNQTPSKKTKTPLSSTSKENSLRKQLTAKRKLFECEPSSKSHGESNFTKRAKLMIDYNIIIKSLHNFKLINVKFLKNYYVQNRNKYIFSQNTHRNEDRISATLYAKRDRFTIRNQLLYALLNLNKKQTHALRTLLKMYKAYEFKFNTNYNCDVSLLLLHLYFRTLPGISQNAIILNVGSKDVENMYDRAEYLKYKYVFSGFNKNKLNELYSIVKI